MDAEVGLAFAEIKDRFAVWNGVRVEA